MSYTKMLLGDVVSFQKGFAFKSKDYCDRGARIVKVTNLNQDMYDETRYVYIPDEVAEKCSRYDLAEDDVVITTVGSWPNNPDSVVGKIIRIPDFLNGTLLNQNAVRLRTNEKCLQKLLFYFLKYQGFTDYIISKAQGSANQASITLSDISKFEIMIPPIDEQEELLKTVIALDNRVTVNGQIIRNLQRLNVSIYNKCFGVNNNLFADEALVPDGWMKKRLADVTVPKRDRVGSEQKKYKVLSAVNSGILKPSDEYFTKQVFSKDTSKYIIVKQNEFAYNPARINIGSIGINDLGYDGCVSPVYVVFYVDDVYQHYFKYFIRSKFFTEQVNLRCFGSVRQALNYDEFGKIDVVWPPEQEVYEFNKTCASFADTIEALHKENNNLNEILRAVVKGFFSAN